MSESDSELTDELVERFGGGGDGVAVARAPGRVNLVGGHVDYNDGIVLPAAIDRETAVAARARDDDVVRAHSLTLDDSFEARVGDDADGWAAYVLGTATVLSEDVGEPTGADLVVGGDMILGAGLSSSASLEVAVGGALNAVHDLRLSKRELADAGWRAENEEVGMACGIMDQFACALGESGHALRIDCRSRGVDRIPFDTDATNVLVVDTNVKHELTDSGFNDRVAECHTATAQLDAVLGKRVRALRDVSPEEVDAHFDDIPVPVDRRARHVTREIRRVEAAANALETGDVGTVGALMRESHRSLREDYEVSCDELNATVDILDQCSGVFGARMVGGGWGGSVAALVDPAAAGDVAETVREEYPERTGIEPDVYVFDVGDGLRVRADATSDAADVADAADTTVSDE